MKYVERCLWDYKANMAMLETLSLKLKDLRSVHGQSYEAHGKNGVSDPVSDVACRVIALDKKIEKMSKQVRPVNKLHDDLRRCTDERSALLWILRLKYFEHIDTDNLKRRLGVSGSTLYRRTTELLKIAKGYFR